MLEIPGEEIAQKIIGRLKTQPKSEKILAAILVDSTSSPQVGAASRSFLKQKEKIAKELGVNFEIHKFSESITESDLIKEIENIAKSENTGGIIVQLPLPQNLSRQNILNAIPKNKDVDALSEAAKKDFKEGKNSILPPAIGVVAEILKTYNLELKNLKTAIVGLGFLVGKPISEWLKDKVAELYLLDIGNDLSILKNVDLIISGVGKAGLIKPGMLKENATVIDFGYGMNHVTPNLKPGAYGDFDALGSVLHASGFYTPTPGGTGPVLVAKLFENFYKLNS